MIYDKLTEIQTQIALTGLYDSSKIIVGGQFNLNALDAGVCIIKSGDLSFDRKTYAFNGTVHVVSVLYSATNIEGLIHNYLVSIFDKIKSIKNVHPAYITTDSNIFEPWGAVFTNTPPHGGFRLDLAVSDVWPKQLIPLIG